MKILEVKERNEWRAWLSANHDKETEVWLVYYKKHTGKPTLEYHASVEDALCYGWIDSIIKKLDNDKYIRKFTSRKERSRWSPTNKDRAERMIREGLMTEYGFKKIEAAKASGKWDHPAVKPKLPLEMPAAFKEALENNNKAKNSFEQLPPSYQKQYLVWINVAKKPETKKQRIKESIRLLELGQRLGLK